MAHSSPLVCVALHTAPGLTCCFSDSRTGPTESEGNELNGTFGLGWVSLHIVASPIPPFQEFILSKVTRLLWEGKAQCPFIYLFSQYLLTLHSVPDTILSTGGALVKRTGWSCGDKIRGTLHVRHTAGWLDTGENERDPFLPLRKQIPVGKVSINQTIT